MENKDLGKPDHIFGVAMAIVVFILVMLSAIVFVGLYLAIKNWG